MESANKKTQPNELLNHTKENSCPQNLRRKGEQGQRESPLNLSQQGTPTENNYFISKVSPNFGPELVKEQYLVAIEGRFDETEAEDAFAVLLNGRPQGLRGILGNKLYFQLLPLQADRKARLRVMYKGAYLPLQGSDTTELVFSVLTPHHFYHRLFPSSSSSSSLPPDSSASALSSPLLSSSSSSSSSPARQENNSPAVKTNRAARSQQQANALVTAVCDAWDEESSSRFGAVPLVHLQDEEYLDLAVGRWLQAEHTYLPSRRRPTALRGGLLGGHRVILCSWLFEVAQTLGLSLFVLHTAINLLNRVLCLRDFHTDQLQGVGVACLILGDKLHSPVPAQLSQYSFMTDDAFTVEDLKKLERCVLNVLGFSVPAFNTIDFVHYLLRDVSAGVKSTVVRLAELYAHFAALDSVLIDIPMSQMAAAVCYLACLTVNCTANLGTMLADVGIAELTNFYPVLDFVHTRVKVLVDALEVHPACLDKFPHFLPLIQERGSQKRPRFEEETEQGPRPKFKPRYE